MLLEPPHVRVERPGELVDIGFKLGVVSKEHVVDSGDFFRNGNALDIGDHHGSEALAVLANLFDLPIANLGGNRAWTDDKDDSIGSADEAQQLALPVFKF